MLYVILANIVVIIHFAFVLFVILGGLLVLRWPRLAWFHLPAALWGMGIEIIGWICPLTPLENWLREKGGAEAYETGFIEHYLLPLLYPEAIPKWMQIAMGLFVLVINLIFYGFLLQRLRKRGH